MAPSLLITGVLPKPPPGTNSPSRLEITQFVGANNHKQFSLYIQALQALYDKGTGPVGSFYQISGIHGRPYVDWNGSPANGRGFCAHGDLKFPTWHRPYVALFEQEIQKIAAELAATYPQADRPAWQQAATDLRQPYWGWDRIETVIPPPEVISLTTVEITKPSGQKEKVPNPFWTYSFPSGSNSTFNPPYNTMPKTVRYPDSNGNSNVNALKAALTAMGPGVVANTQRLYSINNWNDFVFGSRTTTGLESIHGTVHVRTGGSGHMSSVPVAAFDPIFYLHHAQVDRVTDLWYEQHNIWLNDTNNLTPFWNTTQTYWKSPGINNAPDTFNYQYGGVQPTARVEEHAELAQARLATPEDRNRLREWSVRVKIKQFEIGGSFSVYIFLGPIPGSPEEWLTHPNYAGTFDAFVNDNPEECSNCQEHLDLVIKGFVHINTKFLQRTGRNTLSPTVVVPYLRENLNWAIQKVNGEVVDPANLESFEVTVLSGFLSLPEGAMFPLEEEPEYYHDITRGRAGGHHLASD